MRRPLHHETTSPSYSSFDIKVWRKGPSLTFDCCNKPFPASSPRVKKNKKPPFESWRSSRRTSFVREFLPSLRVGKKATLNVRSLQEELYVNVHSRLSYPPSKLLLDVHPWSFSCVDCRSPFPWFPFGSNDCFCTESEKRCRFRFKIQQEFQSRTCLASFSVHSWFCLLRHQIVKMRSWSERNSKEGVVETKTVRVSKRG